MNTNNFKTQIDSGQNILGLNLKKKKAFFILPAMLSIIMLFSCQKNLDEQVVTDTAKAGLAAPVSNDKVTGTQEIEPYDQTLFIPCGNNGAGEEVALSGSLRISYYVVYNEHGFTMNYHVVTQGITGVGLSTGDKYVASGGNKGTITGEFGEEGRYSRVFIQQMRFIGQNTVFKVTYKTKITVTPDGKVTTDIDEETVDCND